MNRRTTAFLGAVAGLALTLLGASPAAAVATLPATDTIYMVACGLGYNDLSLFSIAPDGTATPIGAGDGNTNGKCAKGATWDAKNQTAYFLSEDNLTSTHELWTMDVESGTPTKVSDIVGGNGFYIHFDSEGAAQTQYDGTFYNLNTTSYTETEIPSSSVNGDNGVYYLVQAFNYADNSLYVINADDTEDDSPPVDNMVYSRPDHRHRVGPDRTGRLRPSQRELHRPDEVDGLRLCGHGLGDLRGGSLQLRRRNRGLHPSGAHLGR